MTSRIEAAAEVWRGAGFTVRTFDDVQRLVWEKLVCNVAFSGTCTVLRRTIGEVLLKVRAAIRGLVPAHTLDALKRRLWVMAGPCQGSLCVARTSRTSMPTTRKISAHRARCASKFERPEIRQRWCN